MGGTELGLDRRLGLGSRRVDGDVDVLAVVRLEARAVLTFSHVDFGFEVLRAVSKVEVDFGCVLLMFRSEGERSQSMKTRSGGRYHVNKAKAEASGCCTHDP